MKIFTLKYNQPKSYFCHIYSITKITEIGANLHVIDAWLEEMKSDALQTY